MGLDVNKIRDDFAILGEPVNGKPLVYLDSAATALKPKCVMAAMNKYYEAASANVHRGVYQISNDATAMYEDARQTAAEFLNAASANEIVFTKGVTSALNLVAMSYGLHNLKPGDEIITTELEHHSSILPWQNVAKISGATLKFIPLTDEGRITIENFASVLTANTKVVALTHISNVMGYLSPIKEICRLAHAKNAVVVVDAAQSAPHMPIDVQALDCDFLAITGHKIYGPTGIGVLYGKYDLLNNMEPVEFGGEMIDEIRFDEHGSTFKDTPFRFEAGTPPIAGAIGLAAGMRYLMNLGWDHVAKHELELRDYALAELGKIEGIQILNPTTDIGIVSYNVESVHPHDMATIYDAHSICVRAGQHCAQPLMHWLGVGSTLRASFSIYNTKAEIDALVVATKEGKATFELW